MFYLAGFVLNLFLILGLPFQARANDPNIKDVAKQIASQCTEAACFSARSYDFPEDFGRLLRASCVLQPLSHDGGQADNSVSCWKAALNYLQINQAPLESPDGLATFKIGLVIYSCDGIEFKSDYAKRDLCYSQAVKILESHENSWRRSSYVSLIGKSCTFEISNAGNSYIEPSCFEQGLLTLNNSLLPETSSQDEILRLKILDTACTRATLEEGSRTCFDKGLATINLPDMEAYILRAGCSVDQNMIQCSESAIPPCYHTGINYLLNFPRPTEDRARLKYTAGLMITMCTKDIRINDDRANGPENSCIRRAISTLVAASSSTDVQLREQNLQPSIRPLLQVAVECNKEEYSCYEKTLKTFYNSF